MDSVHEFKLMNGKIVFEKNKFDFYNHTEIEKISMYKTPAVKLIEQLKLIQVMAAQKNELIHAKIEKHLATGGTLENFPQLPDETIMDVELSRFGIWETKLTMDIYNNKVFIWLKLMIHPEEDPTSTHFVRGVKFEIQDKCDDLANFIASAPVPEKKKTQFFRKK